MSYCLAYMTAGSVEEAKTIGRALVEDRLAACVNVLPGMVSLYRWEGALEEAAEVVLIAKTRAEKFDALAERVAEIHPYDTPCAIRLDISSGLPAFLDWIAEETA
ncbi:MAG: divalent-cation tolerance protein CutA [Defluviicoccus sp.]|nr:divalent-cation tolerance protein CutA [Defluviicoccus sp.]MDE0383366.1 divalent-cation tolerance protein CutA [Defluviicoccus sp.]